MAPNKASKPARSGETVVIGCKLPHGLAMRVFDMIESKEPVMGGGYRETKTAVQMGDVIKVNGNAVPFGIIPEYPIVGGYALTQGVPKEFWELFEKQNEDQPYVTEHLIFAASSMERAQAQAKEMAALKNGLHPIHLDSKGQVDDPRAGKKIQTAEEQPKVRAAAEA